MYAEAPSATAGRGFFAGRRALGAGMALADAALYVNYCSRQAERNYPPEGKFIEVDGAPALYRERRR
ncbi:MAG TPA: hypothetical protein VFF81_08160 [Noviherbaspirillum sp.]|nr:hypothetical protein [Noviherbaspirillum sp.]